MTDSTRSLQDIYQSASQSFDELTRRLVEGFSQSVESALYSYSDQESQAQQRVSAALSDHEREIIDSMSESLESVRQTITQSLTENEQFFGQLKKELDLSCRSLQQEISDVTEALLRSHLISSKSQQSWLNDRCDLEFDKLQQASFKAKNSLREQAHSVGTKFGESLIKKQSQQFLDLMSSESKVREEVPNITAMATSKSNSKEAEIRMLHKHQVEQLEARIAGISSNVGGIVDAEVNRITQTAAQTEERLRTLFKEITKDIFETSEKFSDAHLSDLDSTSKSARSETSQLSVQLLEEIAVILDELRKEEEKRAAAIGVRAEDLNHELLRLIEDQRLIAADETAVVANILTELKEIETSFEQRMAGMLAKQLTRIEERRDSAVDEIQGTCKSVAAKISYLSGSYSQQIQEQESKVLKLIGGRLDRAKQLIQDAVGDEES